ncbi:MAG: twin-arginine translocase TatA/TatE family subunit [Candidatus Dormibacteraeota bacterium]|nr:twin-arginine translocase TatA/TatE family subunit [Candidatus Dormibacteraeota bacterium]
MGPFNHWPALLIVLVIVLIVWGPGKLPEIGSAVGRAMHEFRKQSSEFQDEIRRSATPESRTETYQSTPVTPAPAPPATDVKPAPPAADANPSAAPDVKS